MDRRAFLKSSLIGATLSPAVNQSLFASVREKLEHQKDHTSLFDVIVIGVGSMGAATCHFLSQQGLNVLGIEQFDIPHEKGSHSGQSRIIRKAYFEHPDYVPLLQRAYENWAAIEKESGTKLFYESGVAYFGEPENILIKGVRNSADKYSISLEELNHAEVKKRFPQFNVPGSFDFLLEPEAGFVTPERSILVYLESALKKGAIIKSKEKTLDWKYLDGKVIVRTDKNSYECNKLVITAGAWTSQLVDQQELEVTQQDIAWVIPKKWEDFELNKFPCWAITDPDFPGLFYGFPILSSGDFGEPVGLKIGHHVRGEKINPDQQERNPTRKEEEKLITFLKKYLPEAYSNTHIVKSCLYTNSKDDNFIIDFVPDSNEQVIYATGFSGHGFKFIPVIGEVLSDLVVKGHTNHPIEFLQATRFNSH